MELLTDQEKDLAAELAVNVAVWADKGSYERPDGPRFEGYGHHFHQGPFDWSSALLWQLGAALASDGSEERVDLPYPADLDMDQPAGMPPYFRFLPEAEIRQALAAQPICSRRHFDRLMEAWLRFAIDYERLPETRAAFTPEPRFQPALRRFVACGLALELDGMFIWTGAMARAMQAAGFWRADVSQADGFAEDFARFVGEIPEAERYEFARLAREPHAKLVFVDRFRRAWDRHDWSRRFRAGAQQLTVGLRLFDAFDSKCA